jgi:hypothetical protein
LPCRNFRGVTWPNRAGGTNIATIKRLEIFSQEDRKIGRPEQAEIFGVRSGRRFSAIDSALHAFARMEIQENLCLPLPIFRSSCEKIRGLAIVVAMTLGTSEMR